MGGDRRAGRERGHIVKAFVVLQAEAAGHGRRKRELQDLVKADHRPVQISARHRIPSTICRKTQTGKLQRFKLRDGAS